MKTCNEMACLIVVHAGNVRVLSVEAGSGILPFMFFCCLQVLSVLYSDVIGVNSGSIYQCVSSVNSGYIILVKIDKPWGWVISR